MFTGRSRNWMMVAWDSGIRTLLVEVDDSQACSMLTQSAPLPSHVANLILNIKELLTRDWQVHIFAYS
ncbi:hypothetical protein JCGZ_13082 [Jatropha curcas]|uniref:RNase H type-1 domain-containing protein n=1 Tax=Jatropha curcas TaxID=180498 RepID=A0A067KLZ7_JATCU|nr:hypothetical protein JCGZ_13082 [Jatropha curcas]